jgi:hypothetical protein
MQVIQLTSKQQILALLAQVNDKLATTTIDGDLFNDDNVAVAANDVLDALSALTQAVDYYID